MFNFFARLNFVYRFSCSHIFSKIEDPRLTIQRIIKLRNIIAKAEVMTTVQMQTVQPIREKYEK